MNLSFREISDKYFLIASIVTIDKSLILQRTLYLVIRVFPPTRHYV